MWTALSNSFLQKQRCSWAIGSAGGRSRGKQRGIIKCHDYRLSFSVVAKLLRNMSQPEGRLEVKVDGYVNTWNTKRDFSLRQ